MNEIIFKEVVLSPGDKVYYRGGEMTYERPLIEREREIPTKIYCSWYDKENTRHESLFQLSELELSA